MENQGLIISITNYGFIGINKTTMTIIVQAWSIMRHVINEAREKSLIVYIMTYWDKASTSGRLIGMKSLQVVL